MTRSDLMDWHSWPRSAVIEAAFCFEKEGLGMVGAFQQLLKQRIGRKKVWVAAEIEHLRFQRQALL